MGESRKTYVAAILCSLLLVLSFFSRLLPKASLWGINHFSYFPLGFAQLVTIVGLLVFMSIAFLADALEKHTVKRETQGLGILRWPLVLTIFLCSAALFWFVKPATYLLGDQQLQLNELDLGVIILRNAPGTVLAHAGLHRLLTTWLNLSTHTTHAVSGCLLGVIFVFFIIHLVRQLKVSRENAILSGLILLSSAPTFFFFGYAENYTFLYVATLVYLYFSLRAIERRRQLLPPLILLLLAISAHYTGVLLLPSFAFLCVVVISKGRRPTRKELVWTISATLVVLFVIYTSLRAILGLKMLIPPLKNDLFPGYTLLSVAHLRDVLNELLLVCPAGILGLLLYLPVRPKLGMESRASLRFALLACLFPMLFLLSVEPGLGFARDWDIFAFAGLTLNVLAITLISRHKTAKNRISPPLLCLAFMAALLLTLWVFINTSAGRSIDRFKATLESDPHSRAYGYEVLAQDYGRREEWPLAVETLKLAVKSSPENPRYYKMLGDAYNQMGFPGLSLSYYMAGIEADSSYGPIYKSIGDLHHQRGDKHEAEEFYMKAVETMPSVSMVWNNIGNLYLSKRKLQLAAQAYKEALRRTPRDPAPDYNLSQVYYKRGDYVLADHYLEKAKSYGFEPNPAYSRALKQALEKQTLNPALP